MTSLRQIIGSGILLCAVSLPAAASAQDQAPVGGVGDVSPHLDGRVAPSRLLDAARAGGAALTQRRQRGRSPVATGALLGAAAALAATAAAARTYGENESGRFCGACMVEWSALTVPIGAGIGAAIGYGVQRARPSVTPVPIFTRQAAAMVMVARF